MTRAQIIHATMRALSMPVTAEVGELGWTADPAYVIYEADTYLGTCGGRVYYKENDGKAIAVWRQDDATAWRSPYLFSTVPENVRYYYGGTHLGPEDSFEYGGVTWYLNGLHAWQNLPYSTPLPVVINPPGTTQAEYQINIMEAANVRIGKGGFALWP